MGGAVARREAATYHDVDALIMSGVAHNQSAESVAKVTASGEPAQLDPKFAGVPLGYFTTRPGTRITLHHPGDVESEILATDEQYKDTAGALEQRDVTNDSNDRELSLAVKAPVFFALARYDALWCTTTNDCATDPNFTQESTWYAPGTSFTSFLVPNAGHSLTLDTGGAAFAQRSLSWLREIGLAGSHTGEAAQSAVPRLRILTSRVRADRRGRFSIRVSCVGPGTCRARAAVRRGATTLANRRIRIGEGKVSMLRVRADAAMRRTLSHGRTVAVRVRLSIGRSASERQVAVLSPRRRP
jgi:hypothetical protein